MKTWGVVLDNVTTHWGQQHSSILANITLQFEIPTMGIMFPLMGPSGQGKSTLLYLLAALKWPSQGKIIWQFPNGKIFGWGANGKAIHTQYDHDSVSLRRRYFGFAFQGSTLSPYLTVIENVAYPLLLQGQEWEMALPMAEKILDDVLLPNEKADVKKRATFFHSFHTQLSGGQRQRVALAQAMIHDPYVLFADEPTGQLDLHTRKQVMMVLKQWVAKNRGQRCLIWVTHHHLDDLDLMGIEHLVFIEHKQCIKQNRADLTQWITTVVS